LEAELYLVDTSAWIHALRRESLPRIRQRLDQLLQLNQVSISPWIRMELLVNVRTAEEYERLDKGLGALPEAALDQETWEMACRLGFTLHNRGVSLPHPCVVTAACAARHKAVLLHADNCYDLAAPYLACPLESYAYLLPA